VKQDEINETGIMVLRKQDDGSNKRGIRRLIKQEF
jgi:hypothetical protein